ncbi:MAG: DUF2877 domain-containing protein [Kosmotoga sp.]|nr:MAG: DUF2877 domain-containing protein [Kosmotoga sp.]
MICLQAKSISSDWDRECRIFNVITKYKDVINLCDHKGSRYSLLRYENDFLPRSAITDNFTIPNGNKEKVMVITYGAEEGFSPKIDYKFPKIRWKNIWREWLEFLNIEPLNVMIKYLDNLEFLIGLGTGTTPAGDDFLTGYITGSFCIKKSLKTDFIEKIMKNLYKTTWFSRQMLEDALSGFIWKRGKEICSALSENSMKKLIKSISNIDSWGHLSGKAWLAGFAYAIETKINN